MFYLLVSASYTLFRPPGRASLAQAFWRPISRNLFQQRANHESIKKRQHNHDHVITRSNKKIEEKKTWKLMLELSGGCKKQTSSSNLFFIVSKYHWMPSALVQRVLFVDPSIFRSINFDFPWMQQKKIRKLKTVSKWISDDDENDFNSLTSSSFTWSLLNNSNKTNRRSSTDDKGRMWKWHKYCNRHIWTAIFIDKKAHECQLISPSVACPYCEYVWPDSGAVTERTIPHKLFTWITKFPLCDDDMTQGGFRLWLQVHCNWTKGIDCDLMIMSRRVFTSGLWEAPRTVEEREKFSSDDYEEKSVRINPENYGLFGCAI